MYIISRNEKKLVSKPCVSLSSGPPLCHLSFLLKTSEYHQAAFDAMSSSLFSQIKKFSALQKQADKKRKKLLIYTLTGKKIVYNIYNTSMLQISKYRIKSHWIPRENWQK